MSEGQDLTVANDAEVPSAVSSLLSRIRPEWKAKSLIQRVERLLAVDPGSACQRLINATVHDLRSKIALAGIDVAQQAASLHKLPTVTKQEDIENYSNARTLELAYRMGLLTRPEWKRIRRCYDIRRDLEHEDDQYEAEISDCVYIFQNCIEIVLARDPVVLLKVTDVEEAVQKPTAQFPDDQFLEDYRSAPEPRQLEIGKFLVRTALSNKEPDVVRNNCVEMLKHLASVTKSSVSVDLAKDVQDRIGRRPVDLATMKVASAAGILLYLRQKSRDGYFKVYLEKLNQAGYRWQSHDLHGDLLGELEDVGGVSGCHNESLLDEIVLWMALCYCGEPGGYGMGRNRLVFYSNDAAPIIGRLARNGGSKFLLSLKRVAEHKDMKHAMASKHVATRYEGLVDKAGDL